MDSHNRAAKKNTSHENKELLQDTAHLIQRPCYQQGRLCQDPTGCRTTRRPPDHRKERQTAVAWTCFQFIRAGQNHLATHSEGRKKTGQTEKEVGRQHRAMDRPGVRQVPEDNGERRKMEGTGCEVIGCTPNDSRGSGIGQVDGDSCQDHDKDTIHTNTTSH